MALKRPLWAWAAWLAPVLLLGCGGSASIPTPVPVPVPIADILAVSQNVVVQLDHNDDGEPDLLTLDTSKTPFVVLEVLLGTPAGDPVDATATFRGQPFDRAISTTLADYLAGSFGVGTRAELDVTDEQGRAVTLVLFE
ncbi:MAG: hypothetical protein ACE5JG_03975 [Planctomycetota bacterium]